eukprot:949532-Pyramimonas_sp.AAC.1
MFGIAWRLFYNGRFRTPHARAREARPSASCSFWGHMAAFLLYTMLARVRARAWGLLYCP